MTITWESRVINYETERKERRGTLEEVTDHPLRTNVITEQRRQSSTGAVASAHDIVEWSRPSVYQRGS
ncbi:hypothetical protein MTO96_040304 [Rhipicephalus appendiculatus]